MLGTFLAGLKHKTQNTKQKPIASEVRRVLLQAEGYQTRKILHTEYQVALWHNNDFRRTLQFYEKPARNSEADFTAVQSSVTVLEKQGLNPKETNIW